MTLWMPKKKPLYAPMLATFGGGSVRGFQGAGADGPAIYTTGTYYPIFAYEVVDDRATNGNLGASPTAKTEQYFRAALNLDANSSYATAHNSNDNIGKIMTNVSSTGVSVDEAFASGGENVDAYRIEWYTSTSASSPSYTGTIVTSNYHNFYDDIANVQSGLNGTKVPSGVGSVQSASYNDGTNNTVDTGNVLINASGATTRNGTDYWASDNSDYCFMGVFKTLNSTNYGNNTDALDTTSSSIAIAIGLSDSDGAPSSGQPPRTGISRRGNSYPSLTEVNGQLIAGDTHAGSTGSGVIVLQGRVV